jgi:lactate dehydrogenase-like 2-hydroxyacid dehydrogenase
VRIRSSSSLERRSWTNGGGVAGRSQASDIAVIGLGRFGGSVARRLERMGLSVLGIDVSAEKVKQISDDVTHVLVLDATNEDALEEADIASFDTVIVAIGEDFRQLRSSPPISKGWGSADHISRRLIRTATFWL